jgi:hypothetical protein
MDFITTCVIVTKVKSLEFRNFLRGCQEYASRKTCEEFLTPGLDGIICLLVPLTLPYNKR